MTMTTESGLQSNAVCKATGLSYRMLDYWTRLGAVGPSLDDGEGSGSRRLWSERDVLVLGAIARVYTDLDKLGIDQAGHGIIARLWRQLHDDGRAIIHRRTVTICVALNIADTCTHPADQRIHYPPPIGEVCARCGARVKDEGGG